MNSILNRIREVINQNGISDTAFARSIDVPQATLANMFQRDSEPKPSWLKLISEKYNVSASWLLTGEGSMYDKSPSNENAVAEVSSGESKIPILSQKVSCGPGQTWESEQNIAEYIDINSLSPKLKGQNVYGFRASGTSMLGAGIKDGDIVLFNADKGSVPEDGIYVFSLDGEAFCKRLEFERLSNTIKIYSVRVADLEKAELIKTLSAEDEGFTDRFNLFGRVFWILRMIDR